ncbi:hypothetical protein NDI76_19375 [Halogeometricum sp. S1BR25-6]|uniref:Uncharacterized protein n=1 Tax=Halogeometricum salsisoli TaxID=2950536 RepID=A0ABU2GJA8_9EURY|nr:hypothetical protein [Halogeometricum sp. S1BR25-6]MDS0300912.1 hypothetical protein [Halogeometricum sp. S1BR25-6]
MTGMKKGAGDDPFADDGKQSEQKDTDSSAAESSSESDDLSSDSQPKQQNRSMQIPYKFRRDGVQDGRTRVPLFLQSETKASERDALRELEDRFDDNVSLTDLREALVMVGLERLDEVETTLEEWGYGMTFE